MEPELLADYACVCGEGPLYHPDEDAIYWTDIETGRLFKLDRKTGNHEQVYDGPRVGGFTIQADGKLLLFRDKGNICLFENGKVLDDVVQSIPGQEDNRFNDVFADPEGRVYCGTLGKGSCNWYRLDTNGELTCLLEGLGCPNGMALNNALDTLYFTDSGKKTIYAFDYDQPTGKLDNQRVFIDAKDRKGTTDGMTIDAEGNVWSAKWGGYCCERYSPEGQFIDQLDVPAPKASCLTFGGPDYDEIYVTTAGGDQKDEDGKFAGALFRIKAGIKGRPEFRSKIGL